MHPSLIACEDHCEFALEGRNLEVEAMLIMLKDSDTTLAGLLASWGCKDSMSIWCLVGLYFGPLNPDIAFSIFADYVS